MLMRVPHFAHFAIIGILGITLLLLTGRVEAMPMRFTHWKTIPVGRYLVDVPEGATLRFNPIVGGAKMELLKESAENARTIAQERISELKNTKHDTQGSMFIKSHVLDNNAIVIQSWGFSFTEESTFVDIYFVAQLHNGNKLYHYANDVLSSDPDSPLFHQYVTLAKNLRPLNDGEPPTESAFCMGNVMLLGHEGIFHEYVSVRATFPDITEFSMAFRTDTNVINYIKLLDLKNVVKEQYASIEPYKRGKTLRKKDHPVNGLPAQELCVTGDDREFHYSKYYFVWNSAGKPNEWSTPDINVVLLYKGDPYTDNRPIRPFPSDAEALAVWDRFINSVRVRSVTMEKQ